jgi:Mg2+ and Co2+ transporter CorA
MDDIDEAENIISTATEYFAILSALNPLVRATRNLHEVLQEARQAVPKDRQLIVLRDRAYSLSRRAELLYNDAKNALDFAIAKRGEEQAASSEKMAVASHRLNLLVAFFFPLATLCAIFGMEIRHGLDQYEPPGPMVAIIGIGLLMGMMLMMFMTRPGKRE